MPRFEERIGSWVCPKIQEDVIFGRYMDPAASAKRIWRPLRRRRALKSVASFQGQVRGLPLRLLSKACSEVMRISSFAFPWILSNQP